MSHIATYQTKVAVAPLTSEAARAADASWRLLREAVELAAKELGGRLAPYIVDYFGAATDCEFGVITPDFRRGVGVKVMPDSGEVRFLYDDYGDSKLAALKICERIQQNYTALALTQALESLNYTVEIEERTAGGERKLLLRGVS